MELVVDLVGMKAFKGVMDGKPIDSASVFTMVKMDERYNKQDSDSLNWKFGHAIEEWKLPSSDLVMQLASLKPSVRNPVAVRLEIERVSNGRETKEVVLGVRPVSPGRADPLADSKAKG